MVFLVFAKAPFPPIVGQGNTCAIRSKCRRARDKVLGLSDSNRSFRRQRTLPSWTAAPVGVPRRGAARRIGVPAEGLQGPACLDPGLCPWRPLLGRLDQFSQFSPPAASRRNVGGGRAGCSWGTSVGRCIGTRIFLAMGLLLMREIRCSGVWHFGQTVSIPSTRHSWRAGRRLTAIGQPERRQRDAKMALKEITATSTTSLSEHRRGAHLCHGRQRRRSWSTTACPGSPIPRSPLPVDGGGRRSLGGDLHRTTSLLAKSDHAQRSRFLPAHRMEFAANRFRRARISVGP